MNVRKQRTMSMTLEIVFENVAEKVTAKEIGVQLRSAGICPMGFTLDRWEVVDCDGNEEKIRATYLASK